MIVIRVAPADVLVVGEEALLLLDTRLVRVGPLGLAIFDECASPIHVGALADRLERRLGSPHESGAEELTRLAVVKLADEGILRILGDGGSE